MRFIPTHVGNTSTLTALGIILAVHPHACGEHARPQAGIGRAAVHPHACGEHKMANHDGALNNGSSPRMWGTPQCHPQRIIRARFIPTHVGNTKFRCPYSQSVTVHPHACGEHWFPLWITDDASGSSPRMWGTHLGRHLVLYIFRFIPTHVGNTAPKDERMPPSPVHPHACGEHSRAWPRVWRSGGSSPRMWGTLIPRGLPVAMFRFIPTHVGNTRQPRCWFSRASVHPHACGEHYTPVLKRPM
mgnify:CR=1 FL=1